MEPTITNISSKIRYDFEAILRFFSYEEGGLKSACVPQQLYRPDFFYKDESKEGFMIWPTFLDTDGSPFERGAIVDISKPITALMTIISDELRVSEHQKRISPGVEFYLRRGSGTNAEGKVLRILDLHLP